MQEQRVSGRGGTAVVLRGMPGERGNVVLVSELWGIRDSLRKAADRFVDEGFGVAMPDLWWRHGGAPESTGPDAVTAALARLNDGQALRDIAAAAALLPTATPRIVAGFCVGGLYARLASAAVPGFAAAVEFYGRIVYASLSPEHPAQPLDLLPGRSCPLQSHFGGADPICPPHHVDELERRLSGQNLPATVCRYPEAGHAFMNPDGPSYNAQAAELAWSRTFRFLDEVLPG